MRKTKARDAEECFSGLSGTGAILNRIGPENVLERIRFRRSQSIAQADLCVGLLRHSFISVDSLHRLRVSTLSSLVVLLAGIFRD